jgi:hypothetical protein
MSNKQSSIEWLQDKLNNVKPTQFCSIETIKKWVEQTKEMHKQQEYETKAFWFGRGILAHTKNRINELKPIRNNEQ